MTQQKTIAGYNLDEVFEKEEARRKAEREAAERQGREDELRQKRDARKAEPVAPAVPPLPATHTLVVPTGSSVALYKNMEFEHPAYRRAREKEKALLTYDASLARLRAAGFERHARPQEVFGLLIDGLEGKLTPQEKKIHDDMFTSYGEWFSLAFERQGDWLISYLDPAGLEWEKDKYVKTHFKYAEQRDFDITGKISREWLDLNLFNDDFIQFLYGRSFADLPQEMRVGERKAQVYLPSDETAWPVSRSRFSDGGGGYDVFGDNFINRASRGVRGRTSMQKK